MLNYIKKSFSCELTFDFSTKKIRDILEHVNNIFSFFFSFCYQISKPFMEVIIAYLTPYIPVIRDVYIYI